MAPGGPAARRALLLCTVLREANPRKLPAGGRREEIPIRRPDVRAGRRARAAAEDELVAHELAVVLAQRPGGRAIAGVGEISALGPLPDVAIQLRGARACGE